MKYKGYMNAVLNTDFYKTGHIFQYPDNTELVFSNLTPRSTKHWRQPFSVDWNGVVVYGLQSAIQLIHESWENTFFSQPKDEIVAFYKARMDMCLGHDAVDVSHIAKLHDLGYLPIEYRTLDEGTLAPTGVPVFTIHNTLPEFFWVVNYLETALSNETWHLMTNATIAHTYRKIIQKYQKRTGGDSTLDGFLCHDFSMRGMMGSQTAGTSASAHLLSFTGTDSIPALDFIEYFYGAKPTEFYAGSVPATEHSVMCMGTEEGELQTFSRLINKIYPKGIVSIVSDTWNFWQVISEYAKTLKPDIMNRDGKVVFRPDSGDPVRILCGYDIYDYEEFVTNKDLINSCVVNEIPVVLTHKRGDELQYVLYPHAIAYNGSDRHEISKWEAIGAVETLWEIFGGTTNEKGYKTLDSHVGLIYGDSITMDRCDKILELLSKKGFAHNNVVFGVGSYTYQYNTRDTFGFAVKATAGIVNGEERNIMKNPKTDTDKQKVSAKGFLKVVKDNLGHYKLVDDLKFANVNDDDNELKVRYVDGKFINKQTFSEIKERLNNQLNKYEH